MTVVRFYYSNGQILRFRAFGHTGYAVRGEDIVCAAISVLTQTAVIGLQEVVGVKPTVKVKDGYLDCNLPDDLDQHILAEAQLVMNVLYKGLQAIYQEYGGEFLRIEEVESCK